MNKPTLETAKFLGRPFYWGENTHTLRFSGDKLQHKTSPHTWEDLADTTRHLVENWFNSYATKWADDEINLD